MYGKGRRHARGTGGGSPQKGDAHRPFRQHQGKARHSTRQDTPKNDQAAQVTDGREQA